jgi:hypothetical protein
MSRTTLLAVAGAAMLATTAAVWLSAGESFFDNANDSASMICSGGQCCCRRGKLVAGSTDVSGNRLTLDPEQFVGQVKDAYQFAGKNPGLISQLWCYCGCDKTDGHRSLLDCYRGNHGAICATCTGEALLAKQMSEQGSPVDQIREAIRQRYESAE